MKLKTDGLLSGGTRKGKRIVGRSLYLPTEAPHFQVQVQGKWYVFCMLPKNASSSIRAIIQAALVEGGGGKVQSLMRNNLARKHSEFSRAHHVMVFLRHPADRVVSAFQNKFIQRKNGATGKEILQDYERATGLSADAGSFEDFVVRYLRVCFGRGINVSRHRDPHIYTQQQQLLPVDYDIVARVDQFDEVMRDIGLSHLLPGRANATSGAVDMPGASTISAEELHDRYRETGETPDKASLLTAPLVSEINHLYRADLEAFGHLFGAKSS